MYIILWSLSLTYLVSFLQWLDFGVELFRDSIAKIGGKGGGREGKWEGERKGGMDGGREGGRERRREGWRKAGREEGREGKEVEREKEIEKESSAVGNPAVETCRRSAEYCDRGSTRQRHRPNGGSQCSTHGRSPVLSVWVATIRVSVLNCAIEDSCNYSCCAFIPETMVRDPVEVKFIEKWNSLNLIESVCTWFHGQFQRSDPEPTRARFRLGPGFG